MNGLQPYYRSPRFETIPTGFRLTVRPPYHWLPILALPVWAIIVTRLIARFWPPIIAVLARGRPGAGDLFVLAVLSALTAGIVWAAWTPLWMLLGRERLELAEGTLRHFRGLAYIGRAREFPVLEVRGFHLSVEGRLTFQANRHVLRVGRGLTEDAVAQVFDQLRARAPSTLNPAAA